MGINYEYDTIERPERITASDLERVAPHRILRISDRSGHMSVTNTRTLQLAGVNLCSLDCVHCELKQMDTPVFNGEICGNANMHLHDFMNKLYANPQTLRLSWKHAADIAVSNGVTAIHAMTEAKHMDELVAYKECLPIDVKIYTQTLDVRKVRDAGLRQIGGCGKVLLDGDTGPHTAAMLEPYADRPDSTGILYYTDKQVEAFMSEAHQAGLQVALHCVGDAASAQFLRVVERVYAKFDHHIRHRIEHFEFGTAEQIKHAKRLGIGISIQPAFNHLWPHDTYVNLLGVERSQRADPVGSVIRGDVPVGFGSDCTVTPCDPLLAIHAAVNHSLAHERIHADDALFAHTYGSAMLGLDEHERGSLAPGMLADLAFLGADPAEVAPEEIKEIPVLRTMVNGEIVYENF